MTADASRQTYPFSLPDLPYDYDALEPHLDSATLRIHHREHHGTYVKKLNEALADEPDLQRLSLAQLLRGVDSLPEGIRAAVKNNGGGHLNHDLFWKTLAPPTTSSRAPRGVLGDALAKDFGSLDAFREKFSEAAGKHFASGWVALARDYATRKLKIADLKEHEVVRSSESAILILDVWEHAYYLKYQNRRPQFIAAFWNVIDWPAAEERFADSPLAAAV